MEFSWKQDGDGNRANEYLQQYEPVSEYADGEGRIRRKYAPVRRADLLMQSFFSFCKEAD